MALETRYAARPDWPVERLVESLSSLLTVRRRPIARQRITFLDTTDGRLVRAGASLALTSDASGSRLQWRQGNQRISCVLDGAVQFAWDLPPGSSMRQRLEPIIEMRRLLPLAEAEQDGMLLDVMNETRKTVARLGIVAGRARTAKRRSPWQSFEPFVTLNALRGYDDQCAGPVAILESRPGLERSELELQGHVLRALGATAPQNESAYRVLLDPAVRTDDGLLKMQRELLRIVVASHAGVLAELDSECLHDFRVAVRRSRSLLAQIQGVLPPAEVEHLATEFAWLGEITGPARDLDVLLLGLRSPSKVVDDELQTRIVAQLASERSAMQQVLVGHLTSERYVRLVHRWSGLLARDGPVEPLDGCGALPLVTSVSQRVWWLYRSTLSSIEHVGGDTAAQELHQIRVNARELRYLIDAAANLYEPEDLRIVLRALIRLESVLGEFHDACVQSNRLREYAVKSGEAARDPTSVHHGAEILADVAERRARDLRKPANQQLLRFGESSTRAAFERVFHIKHLTELVQ